MSTKHNTIGKGSDHRAINGGGDAYFTNPEIAQECTDKTLAHWKGKRIPAVVEPSAGDGAFAKAIKRRTRRSILLFDLHPQHPDVQQADWFDVTVPTGSLVIGNPPFGFAANLAIQFFNHAASQQATGIAFIVPRSFSKRSIQAKLDSNYHLVTESVLPDHSFLLEGEAYNVPCVFQIWERRDAPRNNEELSTDNPWLEFTTRDDAEFAFRRVGGRAGQVLDGLNHSKSSTYFCKEKVKGVKEVLREIDFSEHTSNTAGVKSVSKREIHEELRRYYNG